MCISLCESLELIFALFTVRLCFLYRQCNNFLYFDLYLNTVYAVQYIYFTNCSLTYLTVCLESLRKFSLQEIGAIRKIISILRRVYVHIDSKVHDVTVCLMPGKFEEMFTSGNRCYPKNHLYFKTFVLFILPWIIVVDLANYDYLLQ